MTFRPWLLIIAMMMTSGVDAGDSPRISASIVDSSGKPIDGLNLSIETFLGGRQQAVLAVRVLPARSKMPIITWSSSDPAIASVSSADHFAGGPSPDRLEASKTYVFMQSVGYVTVIAHIGLPYDLDVTVPVYADRTVSLGCRLRYTPGISFEPMKDPADVTSQLDYYVTAPSDPDDPFDQCGPKTPYSSANGHATIHFPGGGVVIPLEGRAFRNVLPDQWRNVGVDSDHLDVKGGTLLFKTRNGRIVKTDGFRLVESLADNSEFPDTALSLLRKAGTQADR